MAEDDGVVALERDHGGFDAVIGWAGVDDQVDPVTEFLDDVYRRGRAAARSGWRSAQRRARRMP